MRRSSHTRCQDLRGKRAGFDISIRQRFLAFANSSAPHSREPGGGGNRDGKRSSVRTGYLSTRIQRSALVAAQRRNRERVSGPMVVLGTAHPAKFPEAVKKEQRGVWQTFQTACSAALGGRETVFGFLPNSATAVADYIRAPRRHRRCAASFKEV